MIRDEDYHEFGDIAIDLQNYRILRDGEQVSLTPKAFDVLRLLLENRNRVVEKQEIFDAVWTDVFVGDNALTKAVKEIRHALGDSAASPRFVETVTKRGYRFIGKIDKGTVVSEVPEVLPTTASRRDVTPNEKSRSGIFTARPVLLLASVILMLSLPGWYLYRRPPEGEARISQVRSLAVLPLKNLTGDIANDYLCDGMTESLIASLSRVDDLRVISRGSAFTYKDQEIDLLEVGRRLGIEAVLMGSVQKDADALRVGVRLINVADGHVMWTKEVNKPANQIFALQDEIARNVAVKLEPQGPDKIESKVVQHNTENTEAYRLYLKGRFFWNQQTEDGLSKSIDYFNRAIAEDPNYVLAYCGVSDAYNSMASYYRAPNAVMPKAKEYAVKALSIDNQSADAHFSMASVLYWYEWDWQAAEQEMKRAIELAPNNGLAHNLYGDYLMSTGRNEEGIAEVQRAIELDPLAHFSSCDLGWQFYHAHQFEKAIAQAQQNFDTVQNCPFDYLYVGQSLEQTGQYDEAAAELGKIQLFAKDWSIGLAEQGYTYAAMGQRTKAERTLIKLTDLQKSQYVDPYSLAVVHLGLGNIDKALEWLEKAAEARSPFLLFIKNEPKFDPLRSSSRFQDIIGRIRL